MSGILLISERLDYNYSTWTQTTRWTRAQTYQYTQDRSIRKYTHNTQRLLAHYSHLGQLVQVDTNSLHRRVESMSHSHH